MTRFTKYTLTVVVLVLAAGAVIYSYHWRGHFSVGGEWLIPAVVVAVHRIVIEIRRLIFQIAKK